MSKKLIQKINETNLLQIIEFVNLDPSGFSQRNSTTPQDKTSGPYKANLLVNLAESTNAKELHEELTAKLKTWIEVKSEINTNVNIYGETGKSLKYKKLAMELNERIENFTFYLGPYNALNKKGKMIYPYNYLIKSENPIDVAYMALARALISTDIEKVNRCIYCKEYFLSPYKRLTKYCSKECLYSFHNSSPKTKMRKKQKARQERSKGNPKYFK